VVWYKVTDVSGELAAYLFRMDVGYDYDESCVDCDVVWSGTKLLTFRGNLQIPCSEWTLGRSCTSALSICFCDVRKDFMVVWSV
jgi:hypothetical protein